MYTTLHLFYSLLASFKLQFDNIKYYYKHQSVYLANCFCYLFAFQIIELAIALIPSHDGADDLYLSKFCKTTTHLLTKLWFYLCTAYIFCNAIP